MPDWIYIYGLWWYNQYILAYHKYICIGMMVDEQKKQLIDVFFYRLHLMYIFKALYWHWFVRLKKPASVSIYCKCSWKFHEWVHRHNNCRAWLHMDSQKEFHFLFPCLTLFLRLVLSSSAFLRHYKDWDWPIHWRTACASCRSRPWGRRRSVWGRSWRTWRKSGSSFSPTWPTETEPSSSSRRWVCKILHKSALT